MTLLLLGVLVWSLVHLIPSAFRPLRPLLIERIGDENKYRGVFALTILLSVVAMVFGWRQTPSVALYATGGWARWATAVLMLPALVLFGASGVETNIKRYVRHPQLTGVSLWAFGHLLANGESRSIVLFGGLLVWALAAMVSINQREGDWKKPARVPWGAEAKPLIAGSAAYAALYFAHEWIAGVKLTLVSLP